MDLGQLAELLAFYITAITAVFAAIMVIWPYRNPIFNAVYLILCFFSVAALYVLLHAHFLAAIQVLVYAGAIMVLFVMIIMFLNLGDRDQGAARVTLVKTVAAACALVFLLLIMVVLSQITNLHVAELKDMDTFGTTEAVARLLFTKYLLPFEAASVLLLAAIVGALALARRDDASDRTDDGGEK